MTHSMDWFSLGENLEETIDFPMTYGVGFLSFLPQNNPLTHGKKVTQLSMVKLNVHVCSCMFIISMGKFRYVEEPEGMKNCEL